jgi:hypothetical protein
LLEQTGFQSIPNHRDDRLVEEGSEDSLFSAAIAATEAKATNNLKT